MRSYFLTTARGGFSHWSGDDLPLARQLWGDPQVTRYICASGIFSDAEVEARLHAEMENFARFRVQYWPFFDLESGELIGCCGLRPHGENAFELGFHLRPQYWGKGYAAEAARAVIEYAFRELGAAYLFAGHNPRNTASARVLKKLGFAYTGDEFYPPTGLHHPSYRLENGLCR